jgi:hypothetical protein
VPDKELRVSMRRLSAMALERERITRSTASAIAGLANLRNLAAHSEQSIEPAQAMEFLAMADAVMFALTGEL